MTRIDGLLSDLSAERESLRDLLAGLIESQWERPPCRGSPSLKRNSPTATARGVASASTTAEFGLNRSAGVDEFVLRDDSASPLAEAADMLSLFSTRVAPHLR
jgi:hypothetical protein